MKEPIPEPVPPAIEWHKTKPYKFNISKLCDDIKRN